MCTACCSLSLLMCGTNALPKPASYVHSLLMPTSSGFVEPSTRATSLLMSSAAFLCSSALASAAATSACTRARSEASAAVASSAVLRAACSSDCGEGGQGGGKGKCVSRQMKQARNDRARCCCCHLKLHRRRFRGQCAGVTEDITPTTPNPVPTRQPGVLLPCSPCLRPPLPP